MGGVLDPDYGMMSKVKLPATSWFGSDFFCMFVNSAPFDLSVLAYAIQLTLELGIDFY